MDSRLLAQPAAMTWAAHLGQPGVAKIVDETEADCALQSIPTLHWEMLLGRVTGPLSLRLIIQPLVATFFAARYALSDARAGRPPYGWTVLTNPSHNRELLREGWKHVGKVFVVAAVVDVIYEVIAFRWIYPGQALIVAAVLSLLPYLLMRGLLNRIIQFWHRYRGRPQNRATRQSGPAGDSIMRGRP